MFLSLVLTSTMAQTTADALRYSRITFGGTARSMGMAGAFSALGADFSTLSTNPAGIGLYKRSEFTVSPSVFWAKTTSKYNGTFGEDSRSVFNLSNAGIVISNNLEISRHGTEWKNMQFAFGVNRLNDFNNQMVMNGENLDNSILTYYNELADGTNYQNIWDGANAFDIGPAFDTYLLDTLPGEVALYRNAMPAGGVWQKKMINQWGSTNEFLFSIGGNYNDKLYVGATFGIPYTRFFEESQYTENALADQVAYEDFQDMAVYNYLDARGTGFNFKFGLIYRAQDWLRISGAVHTPTYYKMRENYYSLTRSYFENGDQISSYSPDGYYEYKLNTPWRAIAGLAFIIKKIGIISADYEYADFGKAKFKTTSYSGAWDDYYDINNDINAYYAPTHNFHVGTEWRINNILLRGGYALYASPYQDDFNDGLRSSFTGGIGFRDKYYFVDVAYVYTQENEDYYLYDKKYVNPVMNEKISNSVVLTLGFKF